MILTIFRLAIVVALLSFDASLAADAQPGKVWRIGYLVPSGPDSHPLVALRQRLRELGYVEGQNVAFEIRGAEGRPERLPALAAELVRLKVDIIVASGSTSVEAAQQATTSIPIVMAMAPDPVASGLVASLARPGGNTTGLSVQYTELAAKRLQLLKDAVPNLARVVVLSEAAGPGVRRRVAEADATAATALGLRLQAVEVRSVSEYSAAFAASGGNRATAAVVGGAIAFSHRAQIAQLAVKHRLATVGPSLEYAEAGYLMGYGVSYIEQQRRVAAVVDRIFKGAKPADLPIEQPTKFYLAINLKTAKALGVTIPSSLLVQADEVIK